VGLVGDPDRVFALGVEVSRLTHGHPTGYLAGGYFAHLIALVLEGRASLAIAAQEALDALPNDADAGEIRAAVQSALDLAQRGGLARPELVETLGAGWTAEEAVAIAVYCALVGRDFQDSVMLAVNHSGDSDSTGALAGNLRGTLDGVNAIPKDWLARLELREVVETIARDLVAIRDGTFDDRLAAGRYPGW
jgi:ADP-ribosyl-[dinitrogen reductase] hydrolase